MIGALKVRVTVFSLVPKCFIAAAERNVHKEHNRMKSVSGFWKLFPVLKAPDFPKFTGLIF